MFLVHLDTKRSGLDPECVYMRVDAAAFQITSTKHGEPNDTFTATFFNDAGAPCNAYTGIIAIETSKVVA